MPFTMRFSMDRVSLLVDLFSIEKNRAIYIYFCFLRYRHTGE